MNKATQIHPTALVSPEADLGEGVIVGPYSIIEAGARVGDGCVIGPYCQIHPFVRMGANNRLHASVILGDEPQDVSFHGRDTWLEIGEGNTFREGVIIHRATSEEQPTRIGSGCYMMNHAHVGHDCQIGDSVILTPNVAIGGHVEVGNKVVFGGNTAVHQFVRIGDYAMIAGVIAVRKDVMPFALVGGEPVRHYRLNSVGLRRAGISGAKYKLVEQAFRLLRERRPLDELEASEELDYLRQWLAAPSKRGLTSFVSQAHSRDKID